jgi:enamine deaminase RidA (YjgF/YER057c/UK114 family)
MERNMPKSEIRSDKVFPTAGPYVQGVATTGGKLVFTSGVLGRDVNGKIVGIGDIDAQSRQCINNIRNTLEAAGGSLKDVTRLNVFIGHARHYDAMNAVRKEMLAGVVFTSVTAVAQLVDPNGLVEMDAIAVIGS